MRGIQGEWEYVEEEREEKEDRGKGGNKIPQNPRLSNFLPIFPRRGREWGKIRCVVARN